ncbi:DUF6188 family protein [Streptomyces sp. NPDC056486]|uniref:DUF6188 family protein n=1 Tax=Streptomyces sp. NPDC056486 TaxID=3345835 RepID=UPI00367458BB
MNALTFTEQEDHWILGLQGLDVTKISIDHQLTLLLGSDAWVVLEGPCRLSQGAASGENPQEILDPGRQDVTAALALFGAKVASAVAFKTGSLQLVFDNGLQLYCPEDPLFEAWQVTGPGDWRFVSSPGGELAVWPGSVASERRSDGRRSPGEPSGPADLMCRIGPISLASGRGPDPAGNDERR